jgi:hypothetical protein
MTEYAILFMPEQEFKYLTNDQTIAVYLTKNNVKGLLLLQLYNNPSLSKTNSTFFH